MSAKERVRLFSFVLYIWTRSFRNDAHSLKTSSAGELHKQIWWQSKVPRMPIARVDSTMIVMQQQPPRSKQKIYMQLSSPNEDFLDPSLGV